MKQAYVINPDVKQFSVPDALAKIKASTEKECERLRQQDVQSLTTYNRFAGAAAVIQEMFAQNENATHHVEITTALQSAAVKILFTALPTLETAEEIRKIRDHFNSSEATADEVKQHSPELAAKYQAEPKIMLEKFKLPLDLLHHVFVTDLFNPRSNIIQILNAFNEHAKKWQKDRSGETRKVALCDSLATLFRDDSVIIDKILKQSTILPGHCDFLKLFLEAQKAENVARFREQYGITDKDLEDYVQHMSGIVLAAQQVKHLGQNKPAPSSPTTAHLLSTFSVRTPQAAATVAAVDSSAAKKDFTK